MSTLVVSNISDGTTTVGASYVTNGSAKAWADMTGTATLNASLNVSSGVDNGTGDYTTNITSAFSSADYAIASNLGLSFLGNTMSNNVNSSSYRNYGFYVNFPGNNTPAVDAVIHTVAFGDLA